MSTLPQAGLAHHESAVRHIDGRAQYVDDLPEVAGTLHAAPILSPLAHGRVRGVDPTAALAAPGVYALVGSADIPGDHLLANFAHDEAIFADQTVQHVGNVMGLVVADSHHRARYAAQLVRPDLETLPAVLSVREAVAQQHWVLPPVHVRRGDAAQALAAAPHVLRGTLDVGGQEHFYLEGQIACIATGRRAVADP